MTDQRLFEKFRGYICQDFSADEEKSDEDEEGDEEADFDDQDLDAIQAGALHVQPKKPPYRKVKLRSLENRSTLNVHGYFLSTDPWWEVTVTLKPKASSRTIHYKREIIRELRCQPRYRIRNDARLDEGGDYGSIIVQFLSECNVPDEAKEYFMRHLRTKVPSDVGHVNFEMLFGLLEEDELIKDEKTRELVGMVKPYVMNAECAILVRQSLSCPTLFELLPQLLPDRMVTLMKQCATTEDAWKLTNLEAAIQEKPWAFGFTTVLRKETNVVLPEVSVDRFNQAGILHDMEDHIQDALHCYYVLKRNCWSNGHTFLWEKGLRMQLNKKYPGYKVKDWEEMWVFLEKVKAVQRKKRGKWTLIFMHKYWKAEDEIVRSLEKILDREDQDLSCLKDIGDDMEDEEDEKEGDDENDDKCGNDKLANTKKDGDKSSDMFNDSSLCGVLDLSQLCKGTDRVDKDLGDSSALSAENIASSNTNVDNDIELVEETQAERDERNFKDDKSQHAAARSIRQNPFTIISGKGGCGKTHVVCTVLAEYPPYAVTMAAPTGKAAANLRKRRKDIGAFTLHQISFQYTLYLRNLKEYEKAKRVDDEAKEPQFKFQETEILVVDECSMVPITVFSKVLHALLHEGKLKKLVLLGDYRQLPSVEPGNLLSDLYKVFKQYGWSIELTKNHRTSSELIVKNATRISEKRMPEFDPERFQMVELPENEGFNDVQFLHREVQKLYQADDNIKDHEKSQFVAFRRADCDLLNEWCCPLYANHQYKDSTNKYVFRTGDKICPTRNANVSDLLSPDDKKNDSAMASTSLQQNRSAIHMPNKPSSAATLKTSEKPLTDEEATEIAFLEQLCTQNPVSPLPRQQGQDEEENGDESMMKEEKRICNGEIYFITHVHEVQEPGKKTEEHVSMTDADPDVPTEMCVTFRELKLKAAVKHAWARTIHTYQGSESETVIYLLGNSGAQNWQHVYTAVTRGKSKVYIIGTKSQLKKAISRDFNQRNTGMKEMLMERIVPKLTKKIQDCNASRFTQTSKQSQVPHLIPTAGASFSKPDTLPKSTYSSADTQCFKTPPAKNLIAFRNHTHDPLTQRSQPVTQCSNVQRFQPSDNQWRQPVSSSPIKTFTSIKDLRKTPQGFGKASQGLRHSTPKQSNGLTEQCNDAANCSDYDEWSNEWSDEHLQQAIDMETTAMLPNATVLKTDTTPPLFEDEDQLPSPTKSPVLFTRPKPKFVPYRHSGASLTQAMMKMDHTEDIVPPSTSKTYGSPKQSHAQPMCNIQSRMVTDAIESDSVQGCHGDQSPPASSKIIPQMKLSPFSPGTSARLSHSWSLNSPNKHNPAGSSPTRHGGHSRHSKDVVKRLYTDMKESPIQDGMPLKRRNDLNDSYFN